MTKYFNLHEDRRFRQYPPQPCDNGPLVSLGHFGSNPGNLEARVYVPPSVGTRPSVVVVLHGCTQTASSYDRGAGWTKAADDYGFIVLFPQQTRANNPNLCFNWFSPRDARRDRGEAMSIAQMVETVAVSRGADRSRIFVTGLSAGGAMAAVMLAAYPDVFAGGAIIAGLPYATANNVPQALERMRGQELPGADKLGEIVRSASNHAGPWPTLSVWHGTNDMTVHRSNARALVDQWRELHEAPDKPYRSDVVAGHTRHVWRDPAGRDVIEEYQISGLGHGTPLSTQHHGSGEKVGPHMLEAGISSTMRILNFWRIAQREVRDGIETAIRPAEQERPPRTTDVESIIENALRTAGLMR